MKLIIKNYLLAILTLLSFVGCNEDDLLPPPPTTIVPEVSSQSAAVGIPLTFTDNSKDALSRTWTFPGGTPSSTTEKEVSVIFNEEGTYVCNLEVSFEGGITDSKDITVNVRPIEEGFANKYIFSFESELTALASWSSWSPEAESPATLTVDVTEGANGTSSSGKVSFTTAGKEIQFFTSDDYSGINDKMDKTKSYEFSFWAKASATTTITAALENSVDMTKHTWATENQAWQNYLWEDKEISTTWTKFTFNIDPSSQPYDVAENVSIKIKMLPDAMVDIWIDEFTLVEKESQSQINELYSNRDAFSFENPTILEDVWGKWENDGAANMTVIETDGADNTSNSLEIAFTSAGEVQVYTSGSTLPVNASIDKDKKYTYSFWAKASETTTITAALENPDPWVSLLWQDQELGTDWVKYSFEIDPSTQEYDGTADNVYVKIKMAPSNDNTTIWFDEFSLVEEVSQEVELYSNRDAFSFEDSTILEDVWGKWENDGAANMTVIETDGANNTSNSLEIAFTSAGEVQVYTSGSTLPVNASIDKDKKYSYSFWAKASETTTITAALENPDPWVSLLWQDQELGTDWVKYSFEIDPSTQEYDGTADNVYVKLKMAPSNDNTTIWLDEFSLVEK